jgi:2-methylisocitrate lyase-like PEP mutase family enzyme
MSATESLGERLGLAPAPGIVAPGAGSPLEARLIEDAGHDVVYVSGYATAAASHAVPDIGLIGFAEVLDNVSRIGAAVDLPLIVDADTGYGDAANVAATVRRLEAAGAAAIQIEDQRWPKRCGHLSGKEVESAETMVRKIRAAVTARRRPRTVIIARTDALAPLGIDEAIARGRAYRAAGADAVFVDAPESLEHLRRIAAEVEGPLVANMSASGKTPLLAASELHELGYELVLFPSDVVRTAARAMRDLLAALKRTGDVRGELDGMLTLEEMNRLLGIERIEAFEERVLAEVTHA